jgi:hypothetical protein
MMVRYFGCGCLIMIICRLVGGLGVRKAPDSILGGVVGIREKDLLSRLDGVTESRRCSDQVCESKSPT